MGLIYFPGHPTPVAYFYFFPCALCLLKSDYFPLPRVIAVFAPATPRVAKQYITESKRAGYPVGVIARSIPPGDWTLPACRAAMAASAARASMLPSTLQACPRLARCRSSART